MEYVPLVNCSVSTPVHMLRSSSPSVMLPWPSARNVPARPKKLPAPAHSSVPLIENAYWPEKLALENFAGGGVGPGPGPGLDSDPPPHPAAKSASVTQTSGANRFFCALIAASSAARLKRAAIAARPGRGYLPAGIPWVIAPRSPVSRAAPCAPRRRCLLWSLRSHLPAAPIRPPPMKNDCYAGTTREPDARPPGRSTVVP